MRVSMITVAALLFVACAKDGAQDSNADSATPATPPATAHPGADERTGGAGVPAGFMGRSDASETAAIDAKYTKQGDMWDAETGGSGSHIMWAPGDSARGSYTASAKVVQVAQPSHREAYGIFVGGSNLDQPTQKYSYFVVGGTGEYLINTRDGDKVTKLRDWTANAAVPKRDASGKADNKLTIHVAADSVHFLVNDALVAALPKSQFPTDGIAGIRIGHNLHVQVSPITITR